MSTSTIEAPAIAPSETIVTAAAKALDDRKSKLDFAKQVEKSRAQGASDADFATDLLKARVELAYGEGASVETYGKDFPMSASKVSQYGTTITQLRDSKAPLTEDTFADWFKLTTTGGSAKVRTLLGATLTDGTERTQEQKAELIRETREKFFADRKTADSGEGGERRITLDGLHKYLEKVAAQDWDEVERREVTEALFAAGSAVDDGRAYERPEAPADEVEAEQVAA